MIRLKVADASQIAALLDPGAYEGLTTEH
jgi:hypothetical protein